MTPSTIHPNTIRLTKAAQRKSYLKKYPGACSDMDCCADCHGFGDNEDTGEPCPSCKGSGEPQEKGA